jgi:acyl-CoA thioester hydrolase
VDQIGEFPFHVPVTVAFRDLDALGHVNNAVYLTYFEHARIGYGLKLMTTDSPAAIPFIVAEATVTYLRPAYYGDQLEVGVRVREIGTKSFVMEYSLFRPASSEVVARGRTVQVWFDYEAGRSIPVPDSFREAVARENVRT